MLSGQWQVSTGMDTYILRGQAVDSQPSPDCLLVEVIRREPALRAIFRLVLLALAGLEVSLGFLLLVRRRTLLLLMR